MINWAPSSGAIVDILTVTEAVLSVDRGQQALGKASK